MISTKQQKPYSLVVTSSSSLRIITCNNYLVNTKLSQVVVPNFKSMHSTAYFSVYIIVLLINLIYKSLENVFIAIILV